LLNDLYVNLGELCLEFLSMCNSTSHWFIVCQLCLCRSSKESRRVYKGL